jgi:hypothetical protein
MPAHRTTHEHRRPEHRTPERIARVLPIIVLPILVLPILVLPILVLPILVRPARAQDQTVYAQPGALTAAFHNEILSESGLPPSMNDWGETGLLQDPSARTGLEGDFNATLSNVNPYTRYNLTLTPTPWLETGFRYTAIIDRRYGPAGFSGDQRYKDRSFDLKFRLVKENDTWPEIALGIRDLAGTGLFSSQYLVASRRWYNFDFTVGMAWGLMASGSSLPNPLGLLSSHFKRPTSSFAIVNGSAGSFNPKAYFTGPNAALFGGLEWQTPVDHLRLKLEYDPDTYQNEPLGNTFTDNVPVNIGLEYAPWPAVTLAAGIERGKTGMLRIAVHSNFNNLSSLLPIRDVPPPPVPRHPQPDPDFVTATATTPIVPRAAFDPLARSVFAALKQQHLQGLRFAVAGRTAYLVLANDSYRPTAIAAGRAARVIAHYAPPRITRIDLTFVTGAITNAHLSLMRRDLENAADDQGSPEEIRHHAELGQNPEPLPPDSQIATPRHLYPGFDWSIEPHLRQQIGGPSDFFVFQLYAALSGTATLAPGLTVTGTYGLDIYNNFSKLTLPSNSVLPHVRSDIKYYLQKGANGVFRLQADQIAQIAPNWYARASAGLLENMFAGVDGEILYKPENTRWAAGLDLNHVVQRGYDELFDQRSYQVTTGALALYYQYSPSTLAILSAGRYLAGDKGATFTLEKTFDSGVTVGIFATKTNVSSAQFGEGSFDKGFFVKIPLDFLTGSRSKDTGSYLYRPLTRDGGQQLDINKPLYQQVINNDPKSINQSWSEFTQ